jgi:DNA-binding transcriptional MerR regulator
VDELTTGRLTTGQVAQAAGLSEKAVRLYVDRGLLAARRATGDGRRLLDEDQVARARLVRLLRALELPLAEIEAVLGSSDPVARFDDTWSARRSSLAQSLVAAEYVRSALAGAPRLDAVVGEREVPERLVLCTERHATLAELPRVIPEATQAVFDVLRATATDLAGPPFVGYHERATDGHAARITVSAPVVDVLRPPAGFALTTDAAHLELVVELDQASAADQTRLVLVHDYLSWGRASAAHVPCGDNRETYLPTWGTGGDGPVMEIAVPVARVGAE